MVEDLYHRIFLKCSGSRSPKKEAISKCWNIVTTILVCLSNELLDLRIVVEDAFNHPDKSNELYFWDIL